MRGGIPQTQYRSEIFDDRVVSPSMFEERKLGERRMSIKEISLAFDLSVTFRKGLSK